MDFISNNIARELPLEEIAAQAELSKFHFHRIFRVVTGETTGDFTRRIRLERAARRLIAGKESVTHLAHSLGFSTSQNFARAFKSHFGKTPSQFRKLDSSTIWTNRPEDVLDLSVCRDALTSEPECRRFPELRIVYTRYVGSYEINVKNFIGSAKAYRKLEKWAQGRAIAVRPLVVAIWDSSGLTPDGSYRTDFCLAYDGPTPETSGIINEGILPGGDHVTAQFNVEKWDIDGAYLVLTEWALEHGYQPIGGPCVEVHTAETSQLMTGNFPFELRLPVSSFG